MYDGKFELFDKTVKQQVNQGQDHGKTDIPCLAVAAIFKTNYCEIEIFFPPLLSIISTLFSVVICAWAPSTRIIGWSFTGSVSACISRPYRRAHVCQDLCASAMVGHSKRQNRCSEAVCMVTPLRLFLHDNRRQAPATVLDRSRYATAADLKSDYYHFPQV